MSVRALHAAFQNELGVSPMAHLRRIRATSQVPVVAGFQGISQDTKEITTLGRGGTDTTAVALAAALAAKREIMAASFPGDLRAVARRLEAALSVRADNQLSLR